MSAVFKERITTKKGMIGEDLVFSMIKGRGHTIYRPDGDKRHPIDALIVHSEKLTIVAADVKTKPSREKWPDTGINLSHFGEYSYIERVNNIPVFLFFVDEKIRKIYGNLLSELLKRNVVTVGNIKRIYPLREPGIIYFSLQSMKIIADFPEDEANKLIALRRSKFMYSLDNQEALNLI